MPGDGLDLELLTELGVYDPDAPDAEEVREYLEFVDREGYDVVELAKVTRLEDFGAALVAKGFRPDARPLAEYGDLVDDPDRLGAVASAFGFSASTIERGHYTPAEINFLQAVSVGAEMFSEEETLYFAQVTGAAMARMAEAAIALFTVDIEVPARDRSLSRTEEAINARNALGSVGVITRGLDPLYRIHLVQGVDRLHRGSQESGSVYAVRQAVGFVDLVGFSSLSESMDFEELTVRVREFEAQADRLVGEEGGRLVKTIGDAVMFSAVDPTDVARAARGLIEKLGREVGAEARGGLSYGDVLVRGGDYYGTVVNVASRFADLALPGELLATAPFAEAVTEEFAFEPAGWRQLKGFAEPVQAMSLRL